MRAFGDGGGEGRWVEGGKLLKKTMTREMVRSDQRDIRVIPERSQKDPRVISGWSDSRVIPEWSQSGPRVISVIRVIRVTRVIRVITHQCHQGLYIDWLIKNSKSGAGYTIM